MTTPSEKLAAIILEALIGEGLLSRPEADKIRSKLAAGKMRPEEWRSAIELSAHHRAAT